MLVRVKALCEAVHYCVRHALCFRMRTYDCIQPSLRSVFQQKYTARHGKRNDIFVEGATTKSESSTVIEDMQRVVKDNYVAEASGSGATSAGINYGGLQSHRQHSSHSQRPRRAIEARAAQLDQIIYNALERRGALEAEYEALEAPMEEASKKLDIRIADQVIGIFFSEITEAKDAKLDLCKRILDMVAYGLPMPTGLY